MTTTPVEFDPPADEPLTTKEGWSRWVQQDSHPPELRLDWPGLSSAERMAYDDLWLGSLAPASRAWPSEYDAVDISDVPEIKSAQVQHRRLVKRHGPFPVLAAACAAWKVKDHMHGNQLAEEQEIRLKKLRPEKERFYNEDPVLHAAFYPEVIAAASLVVTPRWQDDVYNPHRRTKAYAALGRRLGWGLHTDWDPSHRNPLHEWIDPDDRSTRLRSNQPDFAPIRYGGPDAGWTARCI